MEQILEENHSPAAKRKKTTQLLQGIQVNHFILYTSERDEKTCFFGFSPAPCYILVGISRESPYFLLGIQWNHSIEELRTRAKKLGSRALPNGA
jgi:hypothetical protein